MKFITIFLLFISISVYSGNIDDFYNKYDKLLKKYVSKGKINNIELNIVDYNSFAKDNLYSESLDLLLKKIDPNELSTVNEKLAFWINVYNFLTIHLIIDKNEQKSIKNLSSFFRNVWKRYSWEINSRKYTLHQIEHDILRKYNKPEIHFAIVCASVSCPDLRNEVYRPQVLEKQLKDQLMSFAKNSGKGISINNSNASISKIFDWFKEDFNGKDGILNLINTVQTEKKIISYDFLEYDWSLNKK